MRRRPLRLPMVFLAMLLAAAGLAVAAAERFAPPQDVPWKPLSLDQPVGLFTRYKLQRLSPGACAAVLAAGGVRFTPVPDRADGACRLRDVGRVEDAGALAPFSPSRPLMSCRQALAYAVWERQVVQPAARRDLRAGLVGVRHLGTYACRNIRHDAVNLSQHAAANAIDVAGFRLADGHEVTVLADYRRPGPEGRFLRDVRAGACKVFGHTLGPDFNADHRDHLHLDMGRAWNDPGLGLTGFCS
ncbi:extensin family protein [Caulobacter sp. KR2-114]|uniref:extensin-like domain-containing protein n=1 Tax=Caulobacter sp. KR2-114 TaxID=3400912 RepID=UPI003C02AE7B